MEKSNFLEMVEELAETIKKDIINNSKEFVNSGCINFDDYTKGNYTLPRMFVTAYLNNHKDYYSPSKKSLKNFYIYSKKILNELQKYETFYLKCIFIQYI